MENKHIGKIIGLMALMFITSFGNVVDKLTHMNYDYETAGGYAFLITLADLALVSIIMMLVPFICRMVKNAKLSYKSGKRLCLWNSIILFILSSVLLALVDISFIGGIGAIIFYFINKWVYVSDDKSLIATTPPSVSLIQDTSTKPIPVTHICLSEDNKLSCTNDNNNVYCSDSILQQEINSTNKIPIQSTHPLKDHENIPSPNKKTILKYCSKCGNSIDPDTKRCTGCGKQYFKGISLKTILVILVCILFAISLSGNILLSIRTNNDSISISNLTKTNNTLKSDISELNDDISELKEDITEYQKEITKYKTDIAQLKKDKNYYYNYWSDNNKKIDVLDSYIVFIEDDGTNLYHKYDCYKFLGNNCWAHNTEYAKYLGYKPCPLCCD